MATQRKLPGAKKKDGDEEVPVVGTARLFVLGLFPEADVLSQDVLA